jgi:hypothetical protein
MPSPCEVVRVALLRDAAARRHQPPPLPAVQLEPKQPAQRAGAEIKGRVAPQDPLAKYFPHRRTPGA